MSKVTRNYFRVWIRAYFDICFHQSGSTFSQSLKIATTILKNGLCSKPVDLVINWEPGNSVFGKVVLFLLADLPKAYRAKGLKNFLDRVQKVLFCMAIIYFVHRFGVRHSL